MLEYKNVLRGIFMNWFRAFTIVNNDVNRRKEKKQRAIDEANNPELKEKRLEEEWSEWERTGEDAGGCLLAIVAIIAVGGLSMWIGDNLDGDFVMFLIGIGFFIFLMIASYKATKN